MASITHHFCLLFLHSSSSVFMSTQQSRDWCFTWNNPSLTHDGFKAVIEAYPQILYLVYQQEVGANGTSHYQGYVEFKSAKKLSTLKNKLDPAIHFERRRGTRNQARDYARKEETRASGDSGPFEFGVFREAPGQGHRSDLVAISEALREQRSLRAISVEYPGQYIRYSRGIEAFQRLHWPVERTGTTQVSIYFGPPGTGKTYTAFHLLGDPSDVYIHEPGSRWFDGYDGQSLVIMDDFSGSTSGFRLDYTLRFLDQYPLRLPIKGGHVPLQADHIIITTNIHPLLWFDWNSREIQKAALQRRISDVTYFPSREDPSFLVDRDKFFSEYERFSDNNNHLVPL